MSIATINPATGEILRNFEPISDSQLEEKLQRAVEAFDRSARPRLPSAEHRCEKQRRYWKRTKRNLAG